MNYTITRQTWLKHIFFFFFFLVLPSLVFERRPGESVFTVTGMVIQYTIANFFLLCFFYLNYYFLLSKFFFEKKYTQYVLWVVLFLIITFPLPHLIVHWLHIGESPPPLKQHNGNILSSPKNFQPPPGDTLQQDRPPQLQGHWQAFSFSFNEFRRHLYLFFTAFFFSFLLKTREHLFKLKEDKLNAELLSLKAQINPHFLFNTLNTIYSLSIKKEDKASDAIVHLSGLMRYVTKDVNENTIPLQKEMDYITNYIELQRARLGNTVKIFFDIFGEAGKMKITPLILITYIENAFKYGVNPDVADCVVKIQLDMSDTGITLHAFNKKVSKQGKTESTGIGMKNTGERLKYLYPKKHLLEINEKENSYKLILSIDLV